MSHTPKSMTMARVYLSEESHVLDDVLDYLRNDANLSGYSVFRAIRGKGRTGEKASRLLDVSLDLPVIIEFFDEKEKVEVIIEHLHPLVSSHHIAYWDVKVNT